MDAQILLRYDPDTRWLRLEVQGDIRTSYPLWGENREKQIDAALSDLRRALRGERISTLY